MAERFFCADPHFGHKGMICFSDDNGKPIRPWGRVCPKDEMSDEEAAERVSAMDEAMVENWNRVVAPGDKVEVLGDVIIGRRQLATIGRLNGRKRLRMGNHDIFTKKNNADYAQFFEEITAYKVFDDLICSHIPLHPESVKQRWKANVHGHLHTGRVMVSNPLYYSWEHDPTGWGPEPAKEIIDPRYLCVSMEHIDYTPITMDEVYRRIREQQQQEGAHG